VPRPTKAIKRQKVSAAQAWKKGDRAEAYKLWEQAVVARKEYREKKRSKKAQAAPAEGGQ